MSVTKKIGGINVQVKGHDHHRVLYLPMESMGACHNVGEGCTVMDINSVQIGGKSFVKVLVDISKERGPRLPDMPEGWDYRKLMRRD